MIQQEKSRDTLLVGFGGKGIKKNVVFEQRAFNYDFGQTMAAALGLQIPNSNGIVLDVFEKGDKK